MKRKNKQSGVYAYLNTLGLLENGSEVELSIARKEYWKKYQANWIRTKRKQAHLTVYFNNKEFRIIKNAARNNKRSNTRYIKEAALAYARNIYLVPDLRFYMELSGTMTSIVSMLKAMLNLGTTEFKRTRQLFDEFLIHETRLKAILKEPIIADEIWLKELLNDDTKKEYLLTLIKET